MHDTTCGLAQVQNWPQNRHRKMESKRKEMMEQQQKLAARVERVEAEQQVASVQPTSCPGLPEPVGSSEAEKRLMEFAKIATGPQSPLLTNKRIDWEEAR